jgi:acetolactate synthase I/II/III large subunit
MNGAGCLLRTLLHCGVDTCFMNPGTSEMQFVSALDRVAGMRSMLCLFEGVCSGAADGYARMRRRPAAHCCSQTGHMNRGPVSQVSAKRSVQLVGDRVS